jgi:hypothetical protein
LEYVRARRHATTGRIGLGLHGTTWAALRSIGSSRDATEHLMGARRGPDLVGPERLRHRPTLGGFSYRPIIGTELSRGRVRTTLRRIASRVRCSAWSASSRPLPSPPAHRAAAQVRSPEGSRSPAGRVAHDLTRGSVPIIGPTGR